MTGSVCILVALSVAQANDWQSSPHAHPSEIRSTASPSEEDGHAGHGHGDTATGPNQPTRANDVLAVPSLPDERGIDRSWGDLQSALDGKATAASPSEPSASRRTLRSAGVAVPPPTPPSRRASTSGTAVAPPRDRGRLREWLESGELLPEVEEHRNVTEPHVTEPQITEARVARAADHRRGSQSVSADGGGSLPSAQGGSAPNGGARYLQPPTELSDPQGDRTSGGRSADADRSDAPPRHLRDLPNRSLRSAGDDRGPGGIPDGRANASSASASVPGNVAPGPHPLDPSQARGSDSVEGEANAEARQSTSQWFPLMLTLLALFASIGLNVYLGWSVWDLYGRYHDAVEDLHELEAKYEEVAREQQLRRSASPRRRAESLAG